MIITVEACVTSKWEKYPELTWTFHNKHHIPVIFIYCKDRKTFLERTRW